MQNNTPKLTAKDCMLCDGTKDAKIFFTAEERQEGNPAEEIQERHEYEVFIHFRLHKILTFLCVHFLPFSALKAIVGYCRVLLSTE